MSDQLPLFASTEVNLAARADHEFYPTPSWVTRLILPHLALTDGIILEPAAGQGAIVEVLLDAGVSAHRLVGVELRAEGAEAVRDLGVRCACCSFLDDGAYKAALRSEPAWTHDDVRPGLVITNPPFSLALDFADRAISLAGAHGTVAMLVRLGWLASAKRRAWHQAHPADVYILPQRPSFTGNGNSDRYDLCWWVHRPNRAGVPGTWMIL
ncbi:MAG: hypothetical protein KKH12_16250 [Gammaproteobacteria bacterium]|nr:hypothetical protein [Gammaproteobacteria bacterium]